MRCSQQLLANYNCPDTPFPIPNIADASLSSPFSFLDCPFKAWTLTLLTLSIAYLDFGSLISALIFIISLFFFPLTYGPTDVACKGTDGNYMVSVTVVQRIEE
jgi:hypothetical protein